MAQFPKKLQKKLRDREELRALRKLEVIEDMVDFSSNDYLGLARNPEVFEKALKILSENGIRENGATGSRLLSGNSKLFESAEKLLTDFYGAENALLFNSGYDANLGFFSTVPQRGDLLFYDELVHASIRDGIRMCNAKSYKFQHNNLEDLKTKIFRALKSGPAEENSEIYVATESVFSMDGDSPNLPELVEFCLKNKYHLVVDEAHAVGVFGLRGEGKLKSLGLEMKVFARVVTFGKALGVHGAAVLGSHNLKTYLTNFARSFIYSTGLPPHSIASIIAAHKFLVSEASNSLRASLEENCATFKAALNALGLQTSFLSSNATIFSCLVPGNDRVKRVARDIQAQKFDVKPILSPTVPKGSERLRFCLHSFNSKSEIKDVLAILATALQTYQHEE